MRYHVPILTVPAEGSEQLGGTPFGFPEERWPSCTDCDRPQSLVAQVRHEEGRLDLGEAGRMLFVFQCEWDPGMCSNWELFSGANACVVLAETELTGRATTSPEPAPPTIPAAGILRWEEREDGIAADIRPAFFDDAACLALEEEQWAKPTGETRLGGVPHWIQSPDEAPKEGWRFVGQLDSLYRFLDRSAPLPPTLSPAADPAGDDPLFTDGPNFGGGLAYLFARDANGENEDRPTVAMFWQCG